MNRNTPEDLVRELLQSNRNLTQDADDDSIRWITIHPFGMTQEEADTGEGKRYYQRIPVDKESGTIVGGLGNKLNGTNIKDLSENLKNVKEDKPLKMSDGEGGNIEKKEEKKPEQVKANSEAEKKNREFLDKAEKDLLPTAQYKYASEKFISENKDTAKEYLDKYSDDKNISDYIKKSYRQDIISGGSGYFDQVVENLKDIKNYPDRKAKYESEKKEITDKLTDYENKLNAIDLKDRRKTKYLNDIKNIKENLEGAYRNFDVPLCPANIDTYEDRIKAVKDFELSKIYRLADKYLRENEYLNYKVSEQDLKSSEQKQKERESRVDSMFERADKKKEEGAERYERGAKVFDFEHGGIPLGQPNINGRLDSTLKRAYRDMDKGYEKYKEGEALESRAKGAEKALSNMRLDDPAIIPKLQEAVKNSASSAQRQYYRDKLDEAIRIRERANSGGLSKETKLYTLREDFNDGRIRFEFDGKPRQEIIDIMKSRGFKWSPSNKAWQRQNTPNGVYSAKKVIEELAQYEND
ncbi:MAG: DUF3560 domain-containing protein [Lachnospiraceae bacterium]|nr:DUF3560 domain-containing protein [Lachnospiraceae bacterium]